MIKLPFTANRAMVTTLLICNLIAGCAYLSLPGSNQVKLQGASLQSGYDLGDTISINLMLENTGRAATAINRISDGTLHIQSLTRDGAPVPSRVTAIDYEEDLASILERNLESVAPGGRIVMTLKSTNDRTLGGQAFRTVSYSATQAHKATYYDVGAAGDYALVVMYQYTGPRGAFGRVFRSATNEITIHFTVAP